MSKQEKEVKNPEEMTGAEILAAMEEQARAGDQPVDAEGPKPDKPAEEPPAPPKEFTYTSPIDGAVYKAATQEELLKKVTEALDNTKLSWREQKQKIEELKPKEEKKAEEFDADKYYTMLASNPLEADRYKDSFDPEKKEMRQFFSEVREKENRQKAVLQFYAEIPEYAKVDTPEVSATFKARMAEAGRSITADNLKLTYYELRAAGKIPDPPAETTERPKAPPPSPSGGSRPRSTRNNELAKAEAMTKEELREYIHKLEREGAPAR